METIVLLLVFVLAQSVTFGAGVFLGWTLRLSKEQEDIISYQDDTAEKRESYMESEGFYIEADRPQ